MAFVSDKNSDKGRMVYSEALPILYGHNSFAFASANAIRSFQSKSLIGYPLGRPANFGDLGTRLHDIADIG